MATNSISLVPEIKKMFFPIIFGSNVNEDSKHMPMLQNESLGALNLESTLVARNGRGEIGSRPLQGNCRKISKEYGKWQNIGVGVGVGDVVDQRIPLVWANAIRWPIFGGRHRAGCPGG